MKLPSGEGIGIDISGVRLLAGSSLEQTTNAARLYYFDSADHPTKLIEQAHTNGMSTPCPEGLRVTSCSAQVTVKRIESGPPSALSVRTLVFASIDASELPLPDAQSCPERARLVGHASTPTIMMVEGPTWQSIRSQAIGRARPHSLTYSGGTFWTFTTPPSTAAENRLRQFTRYLTPLSAQDIRCCGSTFDAFEAGAQHKITGQIEYKGRSLTYQSWQESDQKPSSAIVDATANVAIIIRPVRPKLIDLVSLR